jgi:hypothetical protein
VISCPFVVPPDVLLIGGDARRDGIGAADLLKLGQDPAVIQVGIIPAVAADQLVRVGVAAFRSALHDAVRLAPQYHCPAAPGLTMVIHACLLMGPLP